MAEQDEIPGVTNQKAAATESVWTYFFYTGPMETVALTEPQDFTGRIGRVGIGLISEVERTKTNV
jgi:hypothetical protein